MNRAIIYIRVSTKEQAKSGLGLEAQITKCSAFAQARGADTLLDPFVDAGKHGDLPADKRPALKAALDAVRAGDLFIFLKRDRIARDQRTALNVEWTVTERRGRKAHFLSVAGEGTELTGSSRKMMGMVSNLHSEMELDAIRDRTRSALLAKKNRGERYGMVPYGYQLAQDDEHPMVDIGTKANPIIVRKCHGKPCAGCLNLEENAEELAVLAISFEKARHTTNHREIVRQLNAESVPTRKGTPWGKSQIDSILRRTASDMSNSLTPSIA